MLERPVKNNRLRPLINKYYNDEISDEQFKQKIQPFDKKDVVNSLYSLPFGYPSIKNIANATDYTKSFVQDTLHGNDIYSI